MIKKPVSFIVKELPSINSKIKQQFVQLYAEDEETKEFVLNHPDKIFCARCLNDDKNQYIHGYFLKS